MAPQAAGSPVCCMPFTAAVRRSSCPGTSLKRSSALYTKLRDLYNARNKLVHGSFVHGSPDSISLMFESRDAAIEYALDALRVVFQREDLLVGPSSSDRSLRVLLATDFIFLPLTKLRKVIH